MRQNASKHLEGLSANIFFSFETIRKYTGPKLKYVPAYNKKDIKGRQWKRWDILTTIQAPTEADLQIKLHKWCLVVVLIKKLLSLSEVDG